MLNALEETTLAYVLVTDKSNQFYEPRKCWLLVSQTQKVRETEGNSVDCCAP